MGCQARSCTRLNGKVHEPDQRRPRRIGRPRSTEAKHKKFRIRCNCCYLERNKLLIQHQVDVDMGQYLTRTHSPKLMETMKKMTYILKSKNRSG